jgi:hexulose-6-phosphate isomerase
MTDRRQFLLQTSAAILSAGSLNASHRGSAAAADPKATTTDVSFKGRIRKAVKYHMIREELSVTDKFKLLQDLGFDGVEPRTMLQPDQQKLFRDMAAATEATGLQIHGVVHSSNPDLPGAIRQAKELGATSVLHVVRTDEATNYLENQQRTLDIIRRAVDEATKQQIHILVENVWASWLIEPLTMARFIDDINSPWVKVYFDVGNVVRWGWPHHWIQVLGDRIQKLDIKEYDLQIAMNEGMRKGFDRPLGEGTVDWSKVRTELARIGYAGWATAEVRGGDRNRLAEIASQMDDVLRLS